MYLFRALTREFLPIVAAAIALTVSLLAQYAWTYPRGPVAVVAGLFGPLALVLGARLWRRLRARKWPAHAAMGLIVAVAVIVTYAHTAWLLIEAGEPALLAWMLPAALDGLAVMATLAIADQPRPQPVDQPVDTGPDEFDEPAPTLVERVRVARAADPGIGRPALVKLTGASDWDVRQAIKEINSDTMAGGTG